MNPPPCMDPGAAAVSIGIGEGCRRITGGCKTLVFCSRHMYKHASKLLCSQEAEIAVQTASHKYWGRRRIS